MRRALMALGILCLFFGVTLIPSSNLSVQKTLPGLVNSASRAWEISGSFSKGEKVILQIQHAQEWLDVFMDPSVTELATNVTISGPNGDESRFRVFFAVIPSIYDPDPGLTPKITMGRIELVHNDSLTIEEPLQRIGGIINYAGEYTVNVEEQWWMGLEVLYPPESLMLYREVVEKQYPFTSLLPLGVAMLVLGVVMLFVGARSPRHRKRVTRLR